VEIARRRITKYNAALFAIVLIGLLLRVYNLATQSIWWDEAFSVSISKLSLSQIVQATGTDVHPPLYYFILHYWIVLFGTSEVAVRSLSVLFGVLAIPMVYVLGRHLFDEEVGLVSAFILAISVFNIQYSQEARMYTMMLLLALLSMYFFVRFLERSSLAISVGYVLSTVLLLYTHVFGLFIVIAQNIYLVTLLLFSPERTFRLRKWLELEAVVIGLFGAWIVILIEKALNPRNIYGSSEPISTGTTTDTIVQSTLAQYAHALIQTFTTYAGTTLLLVIFFALAVLSFFTYRKIRGSMDWKAPLKAFESYSWELHISQTTTVYFLIVWLLTISVIPLIGAGFVGQMFGKSELVYPARYVIGASVALYVLVAKGLRNINYTYAKLAVICVIVILSVANLQTYYITITKPQAREATGFVDGNLRSDDLVIVTPSHLKKVFDYYNKRSDINVTAVSYLAWASANGSADNVRELLSAVDGHNRVWLVDGDNVPAWGDPSLSPKALNLTLTTLNESYDNTNFTSFAGYRVYLYEGRA
jgi:mannosyltransferase